MLVYRAISKKEKELLENGYLECRKPKYSDRNPYLNYTDYGINLYDDFAHRKHFFLTLDDALSYGNDINSDPWEECYESLSLSHESFIKAIAVFEMPLELIEDYLNVGIYGMNIMQNRRAVVESAIVVKKLAKKYGESNEKIKTYPNASYIKIDDKILKEINEDLKQDYEIKDIDFYLNMLEGKISEDNLNRLYYQFTMFHNEKRRIKKIKISTYL